LNAGMITDSPTEGGSKREGNGSGLSGDFAERNIFSFSLGIKRLGEMRMRIT
jgi:hypothetical protein